MRCTKCGHKLRIGDEFCSKCGAAIEPDIVYDENDARENFDSEYEYENEYQSEHDITGEIHLDPTDTRPKKASSWTAKGIIAAISIASAFVIAIIALNVQNMMKAKEDAVDLSEVEETTATKEIVKETTAAPATQSSGSSWKNPLESLFPSQREDADPTDNSYTEPYRPQPVTEAPQRDYEEEYEEETTQSYREEDEEDYSYTEGAVDDYDEAGDNYYEDSWDYENENTSVGEDIRDFFEGIGSRIRDTAEDYGERLDESINNYRERMNGRGY